MGLFSRIPHKQARQYWISILLAYTLLPKLVGIQSSWFWLHTNKLSKKNFQLHEIDFCYGTVKLRYGNCLENHEKPLFLYFAPFSFDAEAFDWIVYRQLLKFLQHYFMAKGVLINAMFFLKGLCFVESDMLVLLKRDFWNFLAPRNSLTYCFRFLSKIKAWCVISKV